MYDFVCQAFRRFSRDEDGNVFILFGATVVPLMLIMGGAVDVTRYLQYKAELSNAVDSAALALAKTNPDATQDEADEFITEYVDAFALDADGEFSVEDFSVEVLDNGFRITATGAMETMFLPLGEFTDGGHGINEMPVNIVSEVVNGSNRLELALVLDVTGSMNCAATVSSSCSGNWSAPAADSRIVALRSATQTLVNTLMNSENNNPDQIKIGVVPFEGTVNIGSTYAANPPSWVDWSNTAQAYWNGRNFSGWNFTTNVLCTIGTTGCSRVGHKWLFDQLTSANSAIKWEGCVEMRNAPYDILDTTPTTGTPDTLFVPFFWPDAPDRYNTSSTAAPYQYTTSPNTRYNSNYSSTSGNSTSTSSSYNYTYMNNYLQDKVPQAYSSTRPATVQSHLTKYRYVSSSNKATWHTSPSGSNQYTLASSGAPFRSGPNHGCPEAIVPLTSTKSTIIDRLDGLVAYAAMGTYIPIGLVWGWHLLTPNEPFTQGKGPGDLYYDTTLKAIVLFTDGENSTTGASNHNNSYFSGYGFLSANRLGTTSSTSTANSTLDSKTSTLCTNVKNNGTTTDTSDDIRIYVITFGTISSSTQTLMTNCASTVDGETLYWNAPSTSDLEDIFEEIGEDLSDIHLSM